MEKYKTFCPHCAEEIKGNKCEHCGRETQFPFTGKFGIGDIVLWKDPCKEGYESKEDYEEACKQERVVTDTIRIDLVGDTIDIVYELDNGTEVYESELTPAGKPEKQKKPMDEKAKINRIIKKAKRQGWLLNGKDELEKEFGGSIIEYIPIGDCKTAEDIVNEVNIWCKTLSPVDKFHSVSDDCSDISEIIEIAKDCERAKEDAIKLSKVLSEEYEKMR